METPERASAAHGVKLATRRAAGIARRRLAPARRFRLATRHARILPSFLVIGAQRAGTTSLFDYLLRHPDVAGPLPAAEVVRWSRKEVHFFDNWYSHGVDWYRSFFPLEARRRAARKRGGDIVAGEATPYYMFHPLVAERVAATLPDVRLVALLRDPVARAYSHYQLVRRLRRDRLSFRDALAAEERRLAGEEEHLAAGHAVRSRRHQDYSYFRRGLYADQLERWLSHFQREQLLVLFAENLFADPAKVYAETLEFLGVRAFELERLDARTRTARRARAREIANKAEYEPLDAETRAELAARYAEPNARLAALLGRDLPWPSAVAESAGAAGEPSRAG